MTGKILRNSANVHDQDTGELVGYVNPITGREVAAPAITAEAAAAVEAAVRQGAIGGYDQVFAVGGQSNADGRGEAGTSVPQEPHPAVLLYTKGGRVVRCAEPAGRQDDGWLNNIPAGTSPGAPGYSLLSSFGSEIAALAGLTPMMIPCAIGSTSLVTHWGPPATPNDMSSLFGALTNRTTEKMIPGVPPVFVWVGHESDAGLVTETLATGTIGSQWTTAWLAHLRNLRTIFPDCVMLFAQVAAGTIAGGAGMATQHRRLGNSQRLCEGLFGDTSAVLGYESTIVDLASVTKFPWNTNATNTIEYLAPGVVHIRGDGSTALGATMVQLKSGFPYRVTVRMTGTGTVNMRTGSTQMGANITQGTSVLTGVATSNGLLTMYRATPGTAVDALVEILSVERGYYLGDQLSAMAVAHDLPRNMPGDDIHISAVGQVELGRRLARLYAQRFLGLNVNGVGPRLVSVTKSGAAVKVKFSRAIQESATSYGVDLAGSLFRVYLGGVEQTLTEVIRDPGDNTAVQITCAASVASGVCCVTYGDRVGPSGGAWRPGVVYDLDGMPAPMMGPVIAV